jgi:hypothetical protein
MEQAVSQMRTALGIHKPLEAGQQRGMSIDEPCTLKMSVDTWHAIAAPIRMLATAHGLFLTAQRTYHDGVGTIRVKFASRRGELT